MKNTVETDASLLMICYPKLRFDIETNFNARPIESPRPSVQPPEHKGEENASNTDSSAEIYRVFIIVGPAIRER
ncbi:MAG TPA: hypothetical protein VN687_13150 [Blastocatellia bacterium]|nr:hypothetical protein [Blastocatellia bacterium]